MTDSPRIVDAHVHLWDPARTDWYPYLSGQADVGLGDVSGMARRFDLGTYRKETTRWPIDKIVHVAAATGTHSIDETLELDEQANVDGQPDAFIGGIVPAETDAEMIAQLDRQMAATRFRGVRPMGTFSSPVPPTAVLDALRDRQLVFELMAHPDQLEIAARQLDGHEELVVVVEHTGWPRSNTSDERDLWQRGIDALASVSGNVHCKLSGLAMPLGSMDAATFRPWIEAAITTFGVDRCMFASNFPVDGMHGTFDQLYSTYAELAAGFDDQSRQRLFARNAEAVYRC